jgi:hypothetical protein
MCSPEKTEYYERELRAMLSTFPYLKGGVVEAWNEPNTTQGEMSSHISAVAAAHFMNAAHQICLEEGNTCTAVAGDFLDGEANLGEYEKEYEANLSPADPVHWGIHPYSTINSTASKKGRNLKSVETFKNDLPNPSTDLIWITEVGAYYCKNSETFGETGQRESAEYLVGKVIPYLKPLYVNYYEFMYKENKEISCSAESATDSELYDKNDNPRAAAQIIFGEPDLGFSKVSNTASGTAEVHRDVLFKGNKYERVQDNTSDFEAVLAEVGQFEVFGHKEPWPALGYVQTKSTGSHTTEVHWDVRTGATYTRVGNYSSDFAEGLTSSGVFQLFGYSSGGPALGYIATSGTASGDAEFHFDVLSGSSYVRSGDFVTDFPTSMAKDGVFNIFGAVNGEPEVGFVDERHTASGMIEVHWDVRSGTKYVRAGDYVSDFPESLAENGTFRLYGGVDQHPILSYVETSGTGSKKIEVHVDKFDGTGYSRSLDAASDFKTTELGNGLFQAEPF